MKHLSDEELMARLARVPVPEPPTAYWEAFRRNVQRRMDEAPRPAWRRWLVPAAAAGAVGLLVVAGERLNDRTPPPTPLAVRVLPAWSPLPPAEDDEALPVVEELTESEIDVAAWEEGRGLAWFFSGLTEEESATLAEELGSGRQGGTL